MSAPQHSADDRAEDAAQGTAGRCRLRGRRRSLTSTLASEIADHRHRQQRQHLAQQAAVDARGAGGSVGHAAADILGAENLAENVVALLHRGRLLAQHQVKQSARSGSAAKPAEDRAEPAAISEVDVEARLAAMAGADKLNWRTSIVDLFKLVGLDPSYANRKELAQELGRTDYEGSAEDNIWLHKATMREIAKNGGKVPASMTD